MLYIGLNKCAFTLENSFVVAQPFLCPNFVTPWTAAHQASLSLNNYQSLPKFMFIASTIPSSHLILCHPLLRWEPAWGSPPFAKVMRKEAWHTQRRDWASGVPLDILEHLPPKPEYAYFIALCSHLWLYWGLPHQHLALSDKELTYSSS